MPEAYFTQSFDPPIRVNDDAAMEATTKAFMAAVKSQQRHLNAWQIDNAANDAETRLSILPKSWRVGAMAVYDPHAVAKNSRYRVPRGTVAYLFRRSDGWVLTELSRELPLSREYGFTPPDSALRLFLPESTGMLDAIMRRACIHIR